MSEETRVTTIVGSTIDGNTASGGTSEDVIETEPDTFDLVLDASGDAESAYFDGRFLAAEDLSTEQDPPPTPKEDADTSSGVTEMHIMDSTFDI